MKVIINTWFGVFSLPKKFIEMYHIENPWDWDDAGIAARTDARLIEFIETYDPNFDNNMTIVEVPDDATDWEISSYDGYEHIIAVVDGKIVHIGED